MIITCGQCQARFKVAPEQIKVTGSKVRCSRCGYVFMVYRPGGPEAGPGTEGFPRGGDLESPQARREIRRLLYADEKEGDGDFEDAGWTETGLDEATGRPPLRRRPAAPAPEQSATASLAESPDEQSQTEQPDETFDEAFDEQSEPWPEASDFETSDFADPGQPGDDLGLSADPTRASFKVRAAVRQVGDDLPPPASGGYNGEVRPAITRVKGRRNGLFLGLAVFCAALTIGLYYLSSRPEPLALSEGDGPPPAQPAAPALSDDEGGIDPRGIEHITFTPKDNLKHFYRRNEKEGELLIITGRVRNSYPAPRNFIRLRGLLLDQHGNTLADRFVYAGNLISEEDLLTLPKEEIMARLNIKGGQHGQNMNIAPGQEVPFMVVFDKVPPNKDEYRIIPVGSSPSE